MCSFTNPSSKNTPYGAHSLYPNSDYYSRHLPSFQVRSWDFSSTTAQPNEAKDAFARVLAIRARAIRFVVPLSSASRSSVPQLDETSRQMPSLHMGRRSPPPLIGASADSLNQLGPLLRLIPEFQSRAHALASCPVPGEDPPAANIPKPASTPMWRDLRLLPSHLSKFPACTLLNPGVLLNFFIVDVILHSLCDRKRRSLVPRVPQTPSRLVPILLRTKYPAYAINYIGQKTQSALLVNLLA
ncbi:hypothetical protein NLI96_g5023 [Meripilus lineatus]|uniref:Uncharacterized protein n=1 Tax=Meripilus lineatus TaxID=2056292 RepID=A0AAD5V3K0_9APHY|nr:hypothetical protein NLI96_g5023 [Physisporinus lineatus]